MNSLGTLCRACVEMIAGPTPCSVMSPPRVFLLDCRCEPLREVGTISALHAVDFSPPTLNELVIILHGLAKRFVGHQHLLHDEEVIDLLDFHLSDDGPERLARNIGEQA